MRFGGLLFARIVISGGNYSNECLIDRLASVKAWKNPITWTWSRKFKFNLVRLTGLRRDIGEFIKITFDLDP